MPQKQKAISAKAKSAGVADHTAPSLANSTPTEVSLQVLLNATDVRRVIDLLEAIPRKQWLPVGRRENNLATINISSDPAAGLIERITNAIDAVLDREWRTQGCPDEIKSPRDAVDAWFGIKQGKLASLHKADLRKKNIDELADRVRVAFRDSEKPERPTVDVRDEGIGLRAEEFHDSILSLNGSRKLKKFFLSGAFGQGGSTALVHSPFTIIVSRSSHDSPAPVAFTIVRFNPGNIQTDKHGVYEYLVDPCNGHPLLLSDVPESDFPPGTLVRHVQMELIRYSKPLTTPTNSPWHLVHHYLFDPVLPFRIEEHRENSLKGSRRFVGGNHRLLTRDEDQNVEHRNEADRTFRSGQVALTWWVLGAEGDNPRERIRRYCLPSKPIIITYNGQKQGELPNTIIREELKLPYLERYLIVHVDCDNLDPESRRQLFPSTRESLRDTHVVDDLRQLVVETLLGDDRLKDLDHERKKRFLSRAEGTSAENLRRRLAQRVQTFIESGGKSIPQVNRVNENSSGNDPVKERPAIPIQDPPTILEVTTPSPRVVYAGRPFTIKFRTDADPYYFRNPDHFMAFITPAGFAQYTGTTTVVDGYGTTYFKAAENIESESTATITLELRPKRAKALDAAVQLVVKDLPNEGGTDKGKMPTPNINAHWVNQTDALWFERRWNENTVAEVDITDDSVDIWVSADNRRLNGVISKAQRRNIEAADSVKDFYLEHLSFHALVLKLSSDMLTSDALQNAQADECGDEMPAPSAMDRELVRVCETLCGIIDGLFEFIVSGSATA